MNKGKFSQPAKDNKNQIHDNNEIKINPNFSYEKFGIGKEEINVEVEKHLKSFEPINHKKILSELLNEIGKVDFRKQVGLKDKNEKLKNKHFLVCTIENVLSLAKKNHWGICRNHNFIYLYNSEYWNLISSEEMEFFLGEAAEKMGIDKYDAQHYSFREQLYKQFLASAHLPKPEQKKEIVLINLKNGTFEISPLEQKLRKASSEDFITYQLPFSYEPLAKAPIFESFLNKMLPDKDCQKVLAEFLGYVFIKPSTLKLEKTLLLYGSGANGKSVIFEIVNALFGNENVCNYSLKSLTKYDSYERAELANKLINYGSEINGTLETSIFKQLVSGEPVEARQIYGSPFTLTDYAKLIFNCNELPKDVEQSNAYFRRFLILPFLITIPESEQDKQLSKKIIEQELSGVFNWVLDGLNRLLSQKNFTECLIIKEQVSQYRKQSDSVQIFLEEEGFIKSTIDFTALQDLYAQYKTYCNLFGYHPCSNKTFSERLRSYELVIERKAHGNVVYVKK